MPDQGIVRGEVQDVVLHDPGRHDQNRLGSNALRGGRILDELDQPVAENDFAGRDGHVSPDLEGLGPRRLFPENVPSPVIEQVHGPAGQVFPPLLDGGAQKLGVRPEEIVGGEDIEHLPGCKGDHFLVAARDPLDPGGRVVPPLLQKQEGLPGKIVGPALPVRAGKASVLGKRFDAGLGRLIPGAIPQVQRKAQGLADRLLPELGLLPRRKGKVHQPVQVGKQQRRRREAVRETPQPRIDHAVQIGACGRCHGRSFPFSSRSSLVELSARPALCRLGRVRAGR